MEVPYSGIHAEKWVHLICAAGKQELGFIMVMQSTEALMDSQPMMVRGHGTFSRSTLGKGSGGQTMVGSLGTSLKMFHFAEGYMADVTAIGEWPSNFCTAMLQYMPHIYRAHVPKGCNACKLIASPERRSWL